MACMKKIRRAYDIEEDVVEAFEQWSDRTRTKRNEAAQLAMWLVVGLSPVVRQTIIDAMDKREPLTPEQIQMLVDWVVRSDLAEEPAVSSEEARQAILDAAQPATPGPKRRRKA